MVSFMPPEDQEKVDALLKDLPPWELLKDCKTEDQQRYLLLVRCAYRWIGISLHDYFNGRGNSLSEIPLEAQDWVAAHRDQWLAFYKVIQWCWPQIHPKLQSSLKAETPAEVRETINEPGKVLIVSFYQDCLLHCRPLTEPYFRWTPHEGRTVMSNMRLVKRLEASRKKLSPKDQRRLNQAKKYINPRAKAISQYSWLRTLCLSHAEAVQKATKDRTLKKYLKELRLIQADYATSLERRLLNRKSGVVGFEWQDGIKRTMGKYRGTQTT